MSNNAVIRCKIVQNTIKCSIVENRIIIKSKGFSIGDAHNHNNLYYQKEESDAKYQEKLVYVAGYKAYEVN